MVVRAQTKLQGFPTEIRFIIRCIHNSRIYYTSFCAKVIILWKRRAIYKKRCIALVTNIKSLMCTYLHCTIVYNIDMTQNHQHLQNMMFCVEFICLLSFEWSVYATYNRWKLRKCCARMQEKRSFPKKKIYDLGLLWSYWMP